MKESLLQLFSDHPQAAVLLSLLFNILIAVLGIVPSFFLTAANILFFGFWQGTALSFAGEALGAVIAFTLYRKGFKKSSTQGLHRFPKAQRLMNAAGKEGFLLVFSLRLLPFVPSGLVTFAAAIGRLPLLSFAIASSLGKIPALLLEAYSVNEVTKFSTQGKVILTVIALISIVWLIKRALSNRKR